MPQEIDFVITWVDGEDEKWQEVKRNYLPENEYGDQKERYRNWHLTRYWFRGVEKYAPWVRKIHFVTWGHLPPWLDTENEKLHIVRHEDILPDEMRPTFNSSILELYVNRIEGLSEQFVLFNDDLFLTRSIKPEYFFHNGKPKDMLALQPVVANPANPGMSHIFLNNMLVLSKYFKKRDCAAKHPGHFFHVGYPPLYFFYNLLEMLFPQWTGLYTIHGPAPYLKSTFDRLWELEGDYFSGLVQNRFRSDTDVNQYLFREWQKLSGNFCPDNVLRSFRYYEITDSNEKLIKAIERGKYALVCVNDTGLAQDVPRAGADLRKAFEKNLGDKCSFERDNK